MINYVYGEENPTRRIIRERAVPCGTQIQGQMKKYRVLLRFQAANLAFQILK
jgi:hypothetical protein